MRYIYFILFTGLMFHAIAQNSIGTDNGADSRLVELFQAGRYESVVMMYDSEKNQSLSGEFLAEISRLKTGNQNQKSLEKLINNNSGHPYSSLAGFTLGKSYFHNGKLNRASYYLKTVDASDLVSNDLKDHYFMRGYIALASSDYKSASGYFDRSFQLNNSSVKVIYFQGFTSYHLNQKSKALDKLVRVQKDDEYGTSANYFIAKIRLEDGKYEEVIEMAQSYLTDEKSQTNAAFYQVIGEAWALKNQADKASVYFGRAIELHPGKPSAALYYQAGVANFKLGLRKKAIEYFIESGIRSGDYAQLSAFQLARLYVLSNETEKASNAYIEASESADLSIKEEAVFMAGKLLTDQKNYAEGIRYLEDYLESFGDGKWKSEAQQIIAEAYLRTSNYDQAIDHLQKIGITTDSRRQIYQKVTFQKGQLLFNDVQLENSIKWLSESAKYPLNATLENEALYLIADAYFNLTRYKEAVSYYQRQKQPDAKSYYSLGYAQYNLQQYATAAITFEKFLSLRTANNLRQDARVRLADCYYATKAYQKALNMYQLANQPMSEYIAYQLGLVKKNLGDFSGAVQSFEIVINSGTDLKDEATFQVGLLNYERADFEQSVFYFSELISKFRESSFLPESYLNRAVSYTNLNRLEKAKEDYEYILENHIQSDIAFNAILGLQELETKGVKVKDVEGAIEKYKQANPNDKSLEVVEFEFAKSNYFNLDYQSAISSFDKFIKEYPGSSYNNQAAYYMADAYYRLDDPEEANKHFNAIRNVKNELTGRVLSRLGDINYDLENFEVASGAYNELEELGLTLKDTYNGRNGMMKTYYLTGDFNNAIRKADEIITGQWKPLNGERNAILIKAKCFQSIDELDSAVAGFQKLGDTPDIIGAEAMFSLARIEFEKGNYSESNELLFDFNSTFGSYAEWIDKSYLLIADNYVEKEELFQAKATLRSIIQHSTDEEVRMVAQGRLASIENLTLEDSTSIEDNK